MEQKKFNIGQQVWLKHELKHAIVSDNADNDIIYVIVDEMEIPVFAEDVDTDVSQKTFPIAPFKEKRTEKPIVEINDNVAEVKIAFEPIFEGEEIIEFKIYFFTPSFDLDKVKYSLYEGNDLFFTHTFKSTKGEIIFLHTLEFDQLNESPEIELQINSGKLIFNKNLRIKPKNFFNKLVFAPELDAEAYLFSIELALKQKPEPVNNDFKLNPKLLKHSIQNKPSKEKSVDSHHPAERVVDLHIEKIVHQFKNLSNGEIVQIQLSYFQRALNAAMRSHLDHMYVIHGLGKGVLKNAIFDILKSYPGIKQYKNDYHPRYGWGATEIIFK